MSGWAHTGPLRVPSRRPPSGLAYQTVNVGNWRKAGTLMKAHHARLPFSGALEALFSDVDL